MLWPTCIFWANLTPFSLKDAHKLGGGPNSSIYANETLLAWAALAQGESVILHCHRLSLTVIP